VGQPFHLFNQPVGREPFDGLDDACVQRPPPLLEEAVVGHFVGEGVLEGIGMLREEARFVEEFSGLKLPQTPVQRLLGRIGNGVQQGPGHLGANHGGGLQQALVLRR
jgi:hypothetical protein